MVTDPICKMVIDEKKAAGKSEYNGNTYYFCAISCKKKFDIDPENYSKDDGTVHTQMKHT
jgi:YHS domain-containing protein